MTTVFQQNLHKLKRYHLCNNSTLKFDYWMIIRVVDMILVGDFSECDEGDISVNF